MGRKISLKYDYHRILVGISFGRREYKSPHQLRIDHLTSRFAHRPTWHNKNLKNQNLKVISSNKIQITQNIGCRFICVCRGDTRERAFESPDPGECFTYPHDGCKVSTKFSRYAWRSSASRLGVRQVKSWKIWTSKIFEKKFFWRSKWLEKKFFLNFPEVSGTWKKHV